MSCCVCDGSCNHVGPHSYCASHGGMSTGMFTRTTTTWTNPPVVEGEAMYGEIVEACFDPDDFDDAITVTVKLPKSTRIGHWFVRMERVEPQERCSCGADLYGSPVCYVHPRSESEQK